MVKAWMHDGSDDISTFSLHQTINKEITLDDLERIGVIYQKMDPDTYKNRYDEDPEMKSLKHDREFCYSDNLELSHDAVDDEKKMTSLYKEHLLNNDHCQYVTDGSGYFDFRNEADQWMRVHVTKGDLLIIPAGLYQRFSLDEQKYIKNIRLFVSDRGNIQIYRPAEQAYVRRKYIERYLRQN